VRPILRATRLAVSALCPAVFVFWVSCGDANPPSPTQPTPQPQPTPSPQPTPPIQPFLTGWVWDTASRGLAGARVEIIEGAQTVAFTTTETGGRFSIPGSFSDSMSVRASKEGYWTVTQPVPPPNHTVIFWLQTIELSADISGEYTLSLLADSNCAGLPDVGRRRTYNVSIALDPRRPAEHIYEGRLSGVTFYYPWLYGDHFGIGVSGTFVSFGIGEYGMGLVEQLGTSTLDIWGVGNGLVNKSSISGSFIGEFAYCDGLPPRESYGGMERSCPVAPVSCGSENHQFTLTRR
jgi:Carboxypeptidase regulatory-like domain